ncbi:uncharacterized protein KY384_004042 [Bacidia gigantensis]|uniref:uncharacterized protein n=1 Tax=Bacidia gigantensis TaxID=2732470 RepID=UPI001D04FA6B|nr:uncharacterized protein KY384_004042 [Bacidia gigantensis]KAG8530687.1 hypothetical protein KY384_004042 [Bacidia gigantensis]
MASNKPEVDAEIVEFVRSWPNKLPHYVALATFVEMKLHDLVEKSNIRCRFDARAKERDTMKQSIHRRQAKRQKSLGVDKGKFKDGNEIRDAMHDLAGVRIRLYFPSDAENAQEMIMEAFNPRTEFWKDNVNIFSGLKRDKQRNVSSEDWTNSRSAGDDEDRMEYGDRDEWPLGLKARHYRCRLNEADIMAFGQRYSANEEGSHAIEIPEEGYAFEIQVASLIMYAWADVYHDVFYKPYYGETTEDERTFMEIVNGLAHTGELALGQLQTSLLLRQEIDNASFKERWALGDWLRRTLGYSAEIEGLGLLFVLLDTLSVNTPAKLRPFISKIKIDIVQSNSHSKPRAWEDSLSGMSETCLLQAPVVANIIYLILNSRPRILVADKICDRMVIGMAYYAFYGLTEGCYPLKEESTIELMLTDDESNRAKDKWPDAHRLLERWYRIEFPRRLQPIPTGTFDLALRLASNGVVFSPRSTSLTGKWVCRTDKLTEARSKDHAAMATEAQAEKVFMHEMYKGFGNLLEKSGHYYRVSWYNINWTEMWALNERKNFFRPGFFDSLPEERYPLYGSVDSWLK